MAQGGEKVGLREKRAAKPWECRATMGAVRPVEWPHGVVGGVKSPQGADIPGVDEEPRGDKTPGGPTATEVGSGEDGWERGGEET